MFSQNMQIWEMMLSVVASYCEHFKILATLRYDCQSAHTIVFLEEDMYICMVSPSDRYTHDDVAFIHLFSFVS